MGREWSKNQKDAINLTGDLLVSAAAGAGKTAVLTERIARLISEGVPVEKLLVVTFTKAAAAEMKARIQKRLDTLANDCADPERAQRLAAAADACDRANISTIHSFCASVLRRNFSAAEIDPAARVADDVESAVLTAKALDACLEEAFAENETTPIMGFSSLLKAVGDDNRLGELVIGLYSFAVALPDPNAWLDMAANAYGDGFDNAAAKLSAYQIELSRTELDSFSQRARALRTELSDTQEGICAALDGDLSLMLALSLQKTHDEWHDALLQTTYTRLKWVKGTESEDKQEVETYRKAFKNYINKELKEKHFAHTLDEEAQFAKTLAPPIHALRRIVGRFAEIYTRLKTEEGLIDFADMEQLTLKALKNDDIAREYREKFKYVFVDEYQDINPAQEAILTRISDGNRFMVGDVKQSIYRFRMAEPAIFLEKYKSYKGADGKIRVDLNFNYRSGGVILNAVNTLFSQLMTGTVGEIDYRDNAALVTGRKGEEQRGECELALIEIPRNFSGAEELYPIADEIEDNDDDDDDDGGDDYTKAKNDNGDEDIDAAAAEAAYAARRILELKKSERVIENDVPREARWSDFTILLRAAKAVAGRWLSVLSDAGIPCVSDAASGFFDAMEVRVFLDLLRVIDNRRQEIPLLAVMRSPIFGFSDEELIHIRADYEGKELLDCVIAASEDVSLPTWGVKCKSMLDCLARWSEDCRMVGVGEFIGALLDETRFNAYCSALYGGSARSANLESLCEKARQYAAHGMIGLHGFLAYMDNVKNNAAIDTAQSPAIDAVRLMSIHKSKGLEFPIVLIGGITHGFKRSYNRDVGIFDTEFGVGLRSVDGDVKTKSFMQRAIAAREASRLVAEEMRVLYVGMTRAKQHLIMLGATKRVDKLLSTKARPLSDIRISRANSYADWLLGAYFANGAEQGGLTSRLVGGGEISLDVLSAAAAAASNQGMTCSQLSDWAQESAFADYSSISRLFTRRYPYQEDVELPSKLSVTGLVERVAEPLLPPEFMRGEQQLSGADRGTLTHRLMQLVDIAPHTSQSVQAQLDAFTERGYFTPREAKQINVASVAEFFDSPLGRRLVASQRVERERRFNILVPASRLIGADTDAPIMLQGVIDCCFTEDGAWVLIDHKTTRVDGTHTAKTVAEQYRAQLELYSEALTRLTGLPVKEKYVNLLSSNETVRL